MKRFLAWLLTKLEDLVPGRSLDSHIDEALQLSRPETYDPVAEAEQILIDDKEPPPPMYLHGSPVCGRCLRDLGYFIWIEERNQWMCESCAARTVGRGPR